MRGRWRRGGAEDLRATELVRRLRSFLAPTANLDRPANRNLTVPHIVQKPQDASHILPRTLYKFPLNS